MKYIELEFMLKECDPYADILIAKLTEINFDSYIEFDNGIKAYVKKQFFDQDLIEEVVDEMSSLTSISFEVSELKEQNWNIKWEKSFEPVNINEICVVRADFHSPCNVKYEIIINPKMSFGTAHHATTFLMMNYMFSLDFINRSVLDIGSGTGILSILASKLKARFITAIDIDIWAYNNGLENAALNKIQNITFFNCEVNKIDQKEFDFLLVNINRNVILKDINLYFALLRNGGNLLLSGFLEEDISLILAKSEKKGLRLVCSKKRNKWQMLHFIKE